MSFRIVLAARVGEERERGGGRNHVLVGRRTRAQNCPLSRLLLAVRRRRRNLTEDPFSDGRRRRRLEREKSCEIIQRNWRGERRRENGDRHGGCMRLSREEAEATSL